MLKKLLREKLYDVPMHDWVLFAAAVMFLMDIIWLVWILVAKEWLGSTVVINSISAIIGNLVTVGFLIFVGEWAAGKLQLRKYNFSDAAPLVLSVVAVIALYFSIPEGFLLFGIPARFALVFGAISVSPFLAPRSSDIEPQ